MCVPLFITFTRWLDALPPPVPVPTPSPPHTPPYPLNSTLYIDGLLGPCWWLQIWRWMVDLFLLGTFCDVAPATPTYHPACVSPILLLTPPLPGGVCVAVHTFGGWANSNSLYPTTGTTTFFPHHPVCYNYVFMSYHWTNITSICVVCIYCCNGSLSILPPFYCGCVFPVEAQLQWCPLCIDRDLWSPPPLLPFI